MRMNEIAHNWYQISYTIYGFDRLRFVNDITECIPQGDTCQLKRLSFDANGVEARGQLTLWINQRQLSTSIGNQLKAVPGIVSIQPDQHQGVIART